MILLLLAWVGFFGEVRGRCDTLPNNPSHGTIIWNDKTAAIKDRIGHVECNPGYQLPAIAPLVTCKDDDWVVTKCLLSSDNSEIVEFAGLVYNYTEVKISAGSRTYPLRSDLAYVFIAKYTASKATPTVRVHVGLKGKADKPVLINIQQSSESIGFELPYKVVSSDNRHPQTIEYTSTVRELCQHREQKEKEERVHVLVSSIDNNFTANEAFFNLEITFAQDYSVALNQTHKIKTSPNNIEWFSFEWPEDKPRIKSVVINLTSTEHHCELISIQNQTCNVYEESSSENYIGDRLTMTTKAAVLVSRRIFPSKFYLSVTTAMDDSVCGATVKQYNGAHKTVNFTIHLHHQSNGFLFLPTLLVPICSFLVMFGTLYLKYEGKSNPAISVQGDENLARDRDDQSPASMEIEAEDINNNFSNREQRSRTISYGDDAFMLPNMFQMQIGQFSRHSLIPIIVAVAIIPIFTELISTHITKYHYYGDLDACYFNIECSFPIGLLPDGGRVVSNVGYIMFGFTLFWLLRVQEKRHFIANKDGISGIQHDFELFKAITFSIILQGIMGFMYHMCPNKSAEAVEKLFFFLALGFIMLKIYQSRHPDIKNAVYIPIMGTFLLLFFHSIKNLMDQSNSWTAWIIITTFHIIITLIWAIQNIFLEKLTFSPRAFYDIYVNFPALRTELHKLSWIKIISTTIAVVINTTIAMTCLITQPYNFHFYLIPIYVLNVLVYLTYYILTKTFTMRERINIFHFMTIGAIILTWFSALYYLYFQTSITTSLSPAQSRARSKPCIGHEMFDGHDIWHVLSAAGLFFTTTLMMILDDDVLNVPLGNLPYF